MVWTDSTVPPFNVISIRSTQKIVPSSKINYKLQESEDESTAKLMTKYIGNELAHFLMGTIF